MPATGNEATRLSQLKSWWDATIATINASINNKLDKPGTAATAGQVLSNNGTQNVWIDAPSGGNEAVRLEQLKGVYPQVVFFAGNRDATITLGNGETVTFSCVNGGTENIYLLVRAMYNSFELLQAVTDGADLFVEVTSSVSMNTFSTKMKGEATGQIYTLVNGTLDTLDVNVGESFSFSLSYNGVAFVGALIYVY